MSGGHSAPNTARAGPAAGGVPGRRAGVAPEHLAPAPEHALPVALLRGQGFPGDKRLTLPLDWLAGLDPAVDAIAHHEDVGVAHLDRPPGGLMTRHSVRVLAVEDECRLMV